MSNRPKRKQPSYGYAVPSADAESSAKPIGLWIGLVVVALVIVGGIVAAAMNDNSSSDNANSGEATQDVTVTGEQLPQMPQDQSNAIPADDDAVGQTIPTIEGKDFDGNPVTIEPGDPQLLVFVAHWCPHCQKEVPLLVQWRNSGVIPKDIKMTAVSTGVDKPRGNYPPKSWLMTESWDDPVVADNADSKAAQFFGLVSYPYIVAVDKSGKVTARGSGELDEVQLTQLVESTGVKTKSGSSSTTSTTLVIDTDATGSTGSTASTGSTGG